ncbi:hypothetical protein R3I93_010653 [Phoxinus phoxinus]|uniref:Uncharacterized protein n=1 Tax=Phoxinus phoxinus TaxID=58324 RepID=A0AAN9H577_9TELE
MPMILEKKCIGFAVPITDAHQMEFRTNQQPSSPSCHASSLYGNCWFNPFHQPRSPAAIPTVTSDLDA